MEKFLILTALALTILVGLAAVEMLLPPQAVVVYCSGSSC
jgi:hypothetical protein